MDRTIKVTSCIENRINEELKEKGKELERKAMKDFSLSSCLFSQIFFVPTSGDKNMILGQFDKNTKAIILSETLLKESSNEKDLNNVFLHELAHALDFAINGYLSGHSSIFRLYCDYLGVEKGFEKAKIKESLVKKDKKRETIKKLLSLSSSPFENESNIAIKKAQSLMLEIGKEDQEEKLYYVTLEEKKRFSLYYVKLINFISKCSGVFTIKCKTSTTQQFRAYGTLEQVEFALYLYLYIDKSLSKEVSKLRQEGSSISKDGFSLGVFQELEKKIFSLETQNENELMVIKNENERKAREIVFKSGIRHVSYSARNISSESIKKGSKFGKTLNFPDKVNKKVLI